MRTALGVSIVLLATACSAVVSFDRNRVRDAGMDAPPTVCDPATHAGCGPNQLCCDEGGQPTCVPTGASQCAACGVACDARSSSACVERACRCGTGPECSGAADLCDDTAGECVECAEASDCTGTQQCVAGRCAACDPSDSSGCGGATPICDGASLTCRGCMTGECPTGLTCVTDSGVCGGCTTNNQCTTRTTPICDLSMMGVCRGCADADECTDAFGGDRPFCLADGRCAACNPADHDPCTGATPVCRTLDGAYACAACRNDGECAGRPDASVCAETGANMGACVECDADDTSACTDGRTCNTETNRCVQCTTDAQCSGTMPVCDADGACRECRDDDECGPDVCLASGACSACDPTRQVGCTNAAQPICDATTATCRGCIAGDCGDGQVCVTSTGRCATCDPTNHNGCSGDRPFCNAEGTACERCGPAETPEMGDARCGTDRVCTASGACAACDTSNNRGCSADSRTPLCDAETLTCRGCTANSECMTASLGSHCTTTGDESGRCGVCAIGTTNGCGGDTPQCAGPTPRCVSCTQASHCRNANYICDGGGWCRCNNASGCTCNTGPPLNCQEGEICLPVTRSCPTEPPE